jgi:hypothetical protein
MIARRPRVVPAVLLLAVLALPPSSPATAERQDTIRILARVDREIVTEFELARYLGQELPETDDGLPRAAEAALVELVLLKLETREARARGVEVSPLLVRAALARRVGRLGGPERFAALLETSPATAEDIRRGLHDHLLVRRLYLEAVTAPAGSGEAPLRGRISPGEAREHYRRHRDRYRRPPSARVSLIEIRPRNGEPEGGLARARDVLARIEEGRPFADLAHAESRGPRAERGGDLGWIEKGHLDPRLDVFAFSAKPGDVSEPIRTPRGGWWIARVAETRPGEPIPFEEVQDRIADELRSERLTRLRRAVLARLVGEAVIEPAALRERVLAAIETIGEPARP